jgi:hypothetical protein
MKKTFLLLALALIAFTSSHAQLTKVLGITGVEDLNLREFVCVLYNKENKAIGVLNENLGLSPFDENKIGTYARFSLSSRAYNSLLLKNEKGFVTRNGNGQLAYKSEDDYKKAFERKENATAGEPYVIKDQKVREVFFLRITDKGKDSGYISLEKPMKSEAKLRLYIVQ